MTISISPLVRLSESHWARTFYGSCYIDTIDCFSGNIQGKCDLATASALVTGGASGICHSL